MKTIAISPLRFVVLLTLVLSVLSLAHFGYFAKTCSGNRSAWFKGAAAATLSNLMSATIAGFFIGLLECHCRMYALIKRHIRQSRYADYFLLHHPGEFILRVHLQPSPDNCFLFLIRYPFLLLINNRRE